MIEFLHDAYFKEYQTNKKSERYNNSNESFERIYVQTLQHRTERYDTTATAIC